ncbi:MAG TPA: right-handed parallel beta-helix repeat-containing protein, partial [Chitinophagales bacterium]|nr:right-handed parallel beta-helix repeat-containing protein [Chitinophagales bacterium]
GHVFTGTYFLDAMGSATASVYLGIYNGALPAVISGSERITLWESMPGNVYKANLALPVKALFVNGVLQTLARHPNSGWLRIDSVPGQQGLISGALVEPDGYWNGASIRMRSKPEFFETRKVQSHAASQILFDDNSWTNQAAGFGFYFDGLPALLDTAGEWHYNPTADTLTFIASAGIDPTQAATNVQASFYDYGLVAAQPTWLVIENLRFERQAIAGVVFNNGCANVTLRNCAFAHNQLKGVLCNGAAAGLRIESCAFNDILGSGVTADQLTNGKLINNQFRRIGLRDGYGINGDAHGNAFTCDNAHDSWFGLNTVDSVAGIALRANGTQDTFYRNVVSNAVLRLSGELGAVSHYSNGAHHILYEENIFYNVFGNCESCDEQSSTASAFLFKYDTHHMTLLRNTVGHVGRHGIHFHTGTHSNTVRGNVVYNAQEAQLYFFNDGANPITHTDNTVVGNVFYSLSPMQQNYLIETLDSAATVSATDSNYYFNPYNYVATTYVRAVDGGSRRSQYPLETWRLQQPVDTASKTSFVRFKRYKTDDIIGANLVSNGLFTNNFNNWSVQPETGAELLLDNSTFMDGGCAKILRTLPLDENVQLSSGSVALSTDQLYQIAFSVYGTKRSAVWTTLYDFGGNFAPRSFAVWYRTTAARNNITDHFKAQASEFEQRLKFTMSAIDSVYWFDNISVLPVTATKLDSTLYSRLLINPSANPVT